jgi:hypothetical protein
MSRPNSRYNTERSNDQSSDDWKAEVFVNVYVPYKKADDTIGRYKLGGRGLPIGTKTANDAKLVEMFKKDPEAFTAMIQKNIIIDVQSAAGAPAVDFVFS